MTDRPIIFSAPMVRALLDGRKTQTRRVMRVQPPTPQQFPGSVFGLSRSLANGVKAYSLNNYDHLPKHPTDWDLDGSVGVASDAGFPTRYRVPYTVGDRLWVRESHWRYGAWRKNGLTKSGKQKWRFQPADDTQMSLAFTDDAPLPGTPSDRSRQGWYRRPSIHMPRWASRLTLLVSDVRVQRLHEISEADAAAEGGLQLRSGRWVTAQGEQYVGLARHTAKGWFYDLWDSINGPDAWDANPWIVAVTFAVQHGNIDAHPAPGTGNAP